MSKARVALGTLVGAIGGFITGILVAPKSGKETRDDIKYGADRAKDISLEKAEEMKQKTSQVATDVAEKAKDVVGEVGDKAKNVAEDVTAKAEEVRGRVEQAVEGAKKGFTKKPTTTKK